jgi:hypothetical protein
MEAAFTAWALMGTLTKMVNELFGDGGQCRRLGRNGLVLYLRLAGHKCSYRSCYASNTKIITGSFNPIQGTRRRRLLHRDANHLAATRTFDTLAPHQALDRATRH